MEKYPSPCNACEKAKRCYVPCDKWMIRYRYRQKQINSFSKKLFKSGTTQTKEQFTYSHPDRVRDYLRTHPCKGCRLESTCDTPCGRYLHWYDLRMEMARKKVGL